MDLYTPERLLITATFVICLLVVWLVVRVKGQGLASRLKTVRRIDVADVAHLGQDTRAVLILVDGARLLVVSQKRAGVVVHPLPNSPGEDPRSIDLPGPDPSVRDMVGPV